MRHLKKHAEEKPIGEREESAKTRWCKRVSYILPQGSLEVAIPFAPRAAAVIKTRLTLSVE